MQSAYDGMQAAYRRMQTACILNGARFKNAYLARKNYMWRKWLTNGDKMFSCFSVL